MISQFSIQVKDFFEQLYLNRKLILELTKREFKTKYAENIFGLLWAIVEPLAMMVILWLVFTFLRAGKISGDIPFSIYLLSGILAYDFFNKSINTGAKGIKSYSFLVKTVNFRVAVIPIILISSELLIHLIVLGIMVIILLISGIYPSIYWLQVFYYMFAMYILLIGISWLTASILPFFPDISYIITIVMRLLFFVTPIFWDIQSLPETYRNIVKLNPLAYTVDGYRESLISHLPFWHHGLQTLYFWSFTFVVYVLGIIVFKRLRPHFADVI